MNPETVVYVGEGSTIQMDTVQIKGIDSTARKTSIYVKKDGNAVINEKLPTHGDQYAESDMDLVLDGENANGRITLVLPTEKGKSILKKCDYDELKEFITLGLK